MRILMAALLGATLASGCVLTGEQNLGQVASEHGLINMTTGDGTFENYTATNYARATEIGLGLGFPFWKALEVFPAYDNEELLGEIAKESKSMGANAMINVEPVHESFWGFIFGIYIDYTDGTGIKTQ